MKTPHLYFFVGYPGAGKTTIAKIIEEHSDAVHLWVDHIRQEMFIRPTHSEEENQKLYKILDDQTRNLLNQGKNVIFDTNFNYFQDRELIRQIAKDSHAVSHLIWVNTPINIAQQRAIHHDHKQRNGYQEVMTQQQFDRIATHLEVPINQEQAIVIDGTNLNQAKLLKLLGLK